MSVIARSVLKGLLEGFVLCLILLWPKPAPAWVHGVDFSGFTTINCNGTSADDTAWAAWKTASVAANPALAKLHVTGNCNISSAIRLVEGIQNAYVWAYGASVNQAYFGGSDFYSDNVHNALIQTIAAGNSTVTLITSSDSTRFSVGDLILVGGLSLQPNGSPPNLNFFDFATVTAINGTTTKTISFTPALTNSYKSTWPIVDAGGVSTNTTGPAIIYKMDPTWNTNYQVYGLTVTGGGSVGTKGRTQYFKDFTLSPGVTLAPTVALSSIFVNLTTTTTLIEVDKEIWSIDFNNLNGKVQFQSSSIQNATIENSTLISDSGSISLLGTAKNTTLNNDTIPIMRVGPNGYGHGINLTATNSTIASATANVVDVLISNMTYSGGTFSIARAAGTWSDAIRTFVPGQKYYFGSAGGNDPTQPFSITDITDDGTTTSFATDYVGAVPTSCGIQTCTLIVAYPAAIITQTSTGPADLTQFAAPP